MKTHPNAEAYFGNENTFPICNHTSRMKSHFENGHLQMFKLTLAISKTALPMRLVVTFLMTMLLTMMLIPLSRQTPLGLINPVEAKIRDHDLIMDMATMSQECHFVSVLK